MDFYYMLKDLDANQTKELISLKISELSYKSQAFPKRFIGVDCDINPKKDFDGKEIESDSQAMWQGFIPEDVKIIYSFLRNEEGYTVNNGCYYYIDDHNYLYEFAEYIKKQDIENEIEFLTSIYRFIDHYFNTILSEEQHRKKMNQPLFNRDGRYIRPSIGHRFLDFKSSNNAECSEYSAMAQNILSIFGYQCIYFGGSVNTTYGSGGHAFNLTIVDGNPCIIDFTIPVETYSLDGKMLNMSPFLGIIEDFNSETLMNHLLKYIPYDFPDYSYLKTSNDYLMISTGEERNYVVGNVEYYNQKDKKRNK